MINPNENYLSFFALGSCLWNEIIIVELFAPINSPEPIFSILGSLKYLSLFTLFQFTLRKVSFTESPRMSNNENDFTSSTEADDDNAS